MNFICGFYCSGILTSPLKPETVVVVLFRCVELIFPHSAWLLREYRLKITWVEHEITAAWFFNAVICIGNVDVWQEASPGLHQKQMFPRERTHSPQSLSISDTFRHRVSLLTLNHKIQMWLDESEPQSGGSFHLSFCWRLAESLRV